MEEIILISWLNDFIFCPVSIYFHNLYGALNKTLYQSSYQLNGTKAHQSIDTGTYSDKKSILQGINVYSQEFGIQGKIFDFIQQYYRWFMKNGKIENFPKAVILDDNY